MEAIHSLGVADQSDCLKSFLLYNVRPILIDNSRSHQLNTTPTPSKTSKPTRITSQSNSYSNIQTDLIRDTVRAKLFIVFDMPTQPPLPPLLTPYVSSLPQSSLTLVSSVLGATGNWLLLRYLYAALSASSSANVSLGADGLDNGKKRKVVLVSFLRGWEFWRSEAKRLVSFSI